MTWRALTGRQQRALDLLAELADEHDQPGPDSEPAVVTSRPKFSWVWNDQRFTGGVAMTWIDIQESAFHCEGCDWARWRCGSGCRALVE